MRKNLIKDYIKVPKWWLIDFSELENKQVKHSIKAHKLKPFDLSDLKKVQEAIKKDEQT